MPFPFLLESVDVRLVRLSSGRSQREGVGGELEKGAVDNQGEAHRVVLGLRLIVEGPVDDTVPVVNPLGDAVVIPLGDVLRGRQPLGVGVEDVPQDELALLILGDEPMVLRKSASRLFKRRLKA